MAQKKTDLLRRILKSEAKDPIRYSAFMQAWNHQFMIGGEQSPVMLAHRLEEDVEQAIRVLESESAGRSELPAFQRALANFPNPALIVRADGYITGLNDAAFQRLKIEVGHNIDALSVAPVDGPSLASVIGEVTSVARNSTDFRFLQTFDLNSDRSITLSILPFGTTASGERSALVFVIDPQWSSNFTRLFQSAFTLTEAESEVLIAYLNGHSIDAIATMRGRSVLTVRTQFQTIMAKCGTTSRSDLMRMAFALGQFGRDITAIAEPASHRHRKRFEIPTLDGRSIEFVLAGDLRGSPIIYVPDFSMATFPAALEKAFFEAGLCVASLQRPGCGNTDRAPGLTMVEALSHDIACVMRQMQWEKAGLMAHNSSSHFGPALARSLPEAFHCVMLFSVLPPLPYIGDIERAAPWLTAMLRAKTASIRLFRLMVISGVQGWRALGTRRFLSFQLSNCASDLDELEHPDTLTEIDTAMRTYFSQSLNAIVDDAVQMFSDWSPEIGACPVPVHILQGDLDSTSEIGRARALAKAHAGKIALSEVAGAGYLMPMTHSLRFVDWLRQGARAGL